MLERRFLVAGGRGRTLNARLKPEGGSPASALVERDEPRSPLWLLDMETAGSM